MADDANFEFNRSKKAADGHEIIDLATYNKLTKKFLRHGGIIIRGEEAERYLQARGAFAAYIAGENVAVVSEEPTVSDVLEEMYHAEQERKKLFGENLDRIVLLKREIDAQEYLLSVAEKYKIPAEEIEVTKANLIHYRQQLLDEFNKEGVGNEQT